MDGAVVYRFELLTEVAFGELLVVTIFPDPQGRWFVHSWGRFQDRVVAERREMSAAEVTELRKRIDESGFWKLEPIPEPTPDVRPRPLPRSEIDFTQVRIDGSDLTITVRDPASGTHAARVYVDCSPSRTDVAPPLWRAQVYAFRLSGIPEIVARAAPLSACED